MADTTTSLLCVRQPGGSMQIHDENISKNLDLDKEHTQHTKAQVNIFC